MNIHASKSKIVTSSEMLGILVGMMAMMCMMHSSWEDRHSGCQRSKQNTL